jgi:hypothetical protein
VPKRIDAGVGVLMMGAPRNGKLAGHALKVYRAGKSNFSPRLSSCECGASLGAMSSEKQAREWHRQHKGGLIEPEDRKIVVGSGSTPDAKRSQMVATFLPRNTAQHPMDVD